MLPEASENVLRQAEQLISSLSGVRGVRIVAGTEGEFEEIHVLSEPGTGGKQIARDVESALLVELGLEVDHRKISVAHLAPDQEPPAARSVRTEDVAGLRLRLTEVEVRRKTGEQFRIGITLQGAGSEFPGEAEGADTPRSRLVVAAEAVLDALRNVVDQGEQIFSVEAARVTEVSDWEVVVVVVGVRAERQFRPLFGISSVSESREEAAVLAGLDATNRWLAGVQS